MTLALNAEHLYCLGIHLRGCGCPDDHHILKSTGRLPPVRSIEYLEVIYKRRRRQPSTEFEVSMQQLVSHHTWSIKGSGNSVSFLAPRHGGVQRRKTYIGM